MKWLVLTEFGVGRNVAATSERVAWSIDVNLDKVCSSKSRGGRWCQCASWGDLCSCRRVITTLARRS